MIMNSLKNNLPTPATKQTMSMTQAIQNVKRFMDLSNWKRVGQKKSDPIPLVSMSVLPYLSAEERVEYCNALVATQWNYKYDKDEPLDYFDVDSCCSVNEYFDCLDNDDKIDLLDDSGPTRYFVKKRKPDMSNINYENVIELEWELVRNPKLLVKLRRILDYHVLIRTGNLNKKLRLVDYLALLTNDDTRTVVDPQMENERGDELASEKASNVVLTAPNIASADVASEIVVPMWHTLSSTEFADNYEHLVNRFTYWKSCIWDNSMGKDGDLMPFTVMPYQFFKDINVMTMPIALPFRIHRYWRGDIELQFHINSNKFQVGQLQFSWMYMSHLEQLTYNNIYSNSQLPHVLLNAGASNEAKLLIPFKYVRPFIHTSDRKNYAPAVALGTLRSKIVAPLRAGENGPKECTVSIFIRFINSTFTGMYDPSIVDPQMEGIGMMLAKTAINTLVGDGNCDNNIATVVPNYMVPTASHSWCIGNGANENIHNLRLFNTNSGVGRPGEVETNDLLVRVPSSVFGMMEHITWSLAAKDSNKPGTCLWSMDAHPQCDKLCMHSYNTAGQMNEYCMPPVGVVSSMFQYWRGSLELRFDIVCSTFHTGRLLIAYIPGMYDDNKCSVTLAQARNSAHAVFTLQEASSFTFTVPFISDKPWWFRKYGGPQRRTSFTAPSRVYLFVLNELVVMESIVKDVTIIPYIRAGADFEVSIPVQPAIGLNYNATNYVDKVDKLYAKDGYAPWYPGAWVGFYNSTKYILRYGDGGGDVSQFVIPRIMLRDGEYMFFKSDTYIEATMIVEEGAGQVLKRVGYIVAWSDGGYVYGIPFPEDAKGREQANRVAYRLYKKQTIDKIAGDLYPYFNGANNYCKGNPTFTPVIANKRYSIDDDYIYIDPQMEDKRSSTNSLLPTSLLPSSSSGRLFFGEHFNDFKDIMRRYQLLWEGTVYSSTKNVYGGAMLQFPALPGGFDLDVTTSHIWNSLRDGAIPVIMSGYIFFRGGLRYKLVFPSDFNSNVWVQHHPDMPCDGSRAMRLGKDIIRADSYRNHNYGYYIQSTRINNIVEFEVPFYQPGVYGMLRKPKVEFLKTDLGDYLGLGDIVIGLENNGLKSDINVSVYYSIADDFSCNVFRGFNPVVLCDEVYLDNKVFVDPQMYPWMVQVGASAAANIGVPWLFSNPIKKAKDNLVKSIGAEVIDAATPIAKELNTNIQAATTQVQEDAMRWFSDLGLTTAAGNLMHVIANPTPMTVAISLANILIALIRGSMQILASLTEVVTTLVTNCWHIFTNAGNRFSGRTSVEPESEGDEFGVNESRPVIAILFTAICASLGYVSKRPDGYFNLLKNVNMTATLSNNVLTFLKNSTEAIIYMYKYAVGCFNPKAKLESLLDDSTPDIKAWYLECTYLLDPRLKSRLVYERDLISRVFDACVFGSILVSNNIEEHMPGGKVIWDTYREVCKIRNDMIERGKHPDVRFECYPIWFTGQAGIGKSYLTTKFCNDMLKSVNYTNSGTLIYNIAPGLKHWSGVIDPGALVSDDIFQVSGMRLEEELGTLFSICSSSVLNPPMAAVADKERRLNPLLYIMHCNHAFPDLPQMRCAEAVYRRRKHLVEVRLRDEVKQRYPTMLDASDLPSDVTQDFGHLEFRMALNPKDVNTGYTEYMTYDEMIHQIMPKFKRHYEKERTNFRQRMCDMYSLDPRFNEMNLLFEYPILKEKISLKDQIKAYKDIIRGKLAEFDDPNLEEQSYIASLTAKIKAFRNSVFGPEQDEAIPSTSSKLDEEHPIYTKWRASGVPNEVIDMLNHTSMGTMIKRWMEVNNFDMEYGAELFKDIQLESLSLHDILYFCIKPGENKDWIVVTIEGIKYKIPLTAVGQKFRVNATCGSPLAIVIEYIFGINLDYALSFGRVPFDDFSSIRTDDDMLSYLKFTLAVWSTKRRTELMNKLRRPTIRTSMTPDMDIKSQVPLINKGHDLGCRIFNDMYDKLRVECEDDNTNSDTATNMFASHVTSLTEVLFTDVVACEHMRFWADALHDFDNVDYCSSRKMYKYKNALGMNEMCGECTCVNSPCNTYLFKYVVHKLYIRRHQEECDLGFCSKPETVWSEHARRNMKAYTWFERIKERLTCWWEHYLKPGLATFLRYLIRFGPLLLTAIAAIWGLFHMKGEAPPNLEFEQNNYYKWDIPKAPKNAKASPMFDAKAFPQSSIAQQQVLASKLENNMVFLQADWVKDGVVYTRKCRCLMLYGKRMLVLRHYLEEFSALYQEFPLLKFTLFYRQRKIKPGTDINTDYAANVRLHPEEVFSQVAWASVKDSKELSSNFGIVSLPKHVISFKNILSLIATKDQHRKLASSVDMYSIGDKFVADLPIEIKSQYVIRGTDTSSCIGMDRVYTYLRQGRGLCGSVIASRNLSNGNGAIIGMHVGGCGTSGVGVAEPMYREMFEDVQAKLPDYELMELPLEDYSHSKVRLNSNLMMYGCVPPQFAHKESGKTKILPAPLYDVVYEHTMEVNPLVPGDKRQPVGSHPLYDGCEKHGTGDVIPFDPRIVNMVKESVTDDLIYVMKPVRAQPQPLTIQQAVCGDVDIPYFEALNWNSSEGFPLSSQRPKTAHDKKWLFELEEEEKGYRLIRVHTKLSEQMRLRDLCYAKRIKPPTIYVDCLKDTKLPIEKCSRQGCTRIFSIAPIQCSLDIRRHMTDFTAALKKSRIRNGIGIGINPDSLEWTQLVNYLFEVGSNIITIDYKNFGPCLMSQMVSAASECVVKWHEHYTTKEQSERVEWLLNCDILNPVHLCEDLVYQTINGISSGSPLTGEMNSIPNRFYIMCAWITIMREFGHNDWATPYWFKMYVRFVVYGDDLIMSVHDTVKDIFNGVTIKNCLARHGITVTSADKGAEMKPYGSIYSATFLKRGFKPHPTRQGIWLAPVDEKSIYECINWVHVSNDINEAQLEVCRASMDLAYGHGPEFYTKHKKKLCNALSKLNLMFTCKSWLERDNEIFSDMNVIDNGKLDFEIKFPWFLKNEEG